MSGGIKKAELSIPLFINVYLQRLVSTIFKSILYQANASAIAAKERQKMPFKNLSSDFLETFKNSLSDHLPVS